MNPKATKGFCFWFRPRPYWLLRPSAVEPGATCRRSPGIDALEGESRIQQFAVNRQIHDGLHTGCGGFVIVAKLSGRVLLLTGREIPTGSHESVAVFNRVKNRVIGHHLRRGLLDDRGWSAVKLPFGGSDHGGYIADHPHRSTGFQADRARGHLHGAGDADGRLMVELDGAKVRVFQRDGEGRSHLLGGGATVADIGVAVERGADANARQHDERAQTGEPPQPCLGGQHHPLSTDQSAIRVDAIVHGMGERHVILGGRYINHGQHPYPVVSPGRAPRGTIGMMSASWGFAGVGSIGSAAGGLGTLARAALI
jgi:hypothetical protein